MKKGTFTDPRDGKTYRIVEIGSQIWMAENLAYNVVGSKYYENKRENGETYGCLYDWETAMSVCPSGWHLPSEKEFKTLIDFVGGREIAGKKLKATSGWDGNNGTDDFGFTALPSGFCYNNLYDYEFHNIGLDENYWCSSECCSLGMHYKHNRASLFPENHNYCLLSVRCIKNSRGKKYA
ncbi:MAG: fibrobacter succinogenes major paralogous domain-containing protein [Fibromonadaceae bacterium]|nr:fibrobacter succinogenes major paralogous domain-containing protein [Fibromonadaceae bacterium]